MSHETDAASPTPPVELRVHNGNLRFVSGTLLVGHYSASRLSGSEAVVDRYTGGNMAASLALGLYPDAPGSHQCFSNTRPDRCQPPTSPSPAQVLVVGLGPEGQLRGADLVLTVRQAVMAWAQRVAEAAASRQPTFEISIALMGSGGVSMSAGASAQALAQAVYEANERLRSRAWPTVNRLNFVELYLDRATEAWRALQDMAQAEPARYALHPRIEAGCGALPRPLEGGYRGAGYDFISALVDKVDATQAGIAYTLDTRRARSEASVQTTQMRLVNELVRRASNEATRDPAVGRTLFQLLIPQALEAPLRSSRSLLMELDRGTAGIPWELLKEPSESSNPSADEREPWVLRNRLLRKLRTEPLRPLVRDARADDAVLVVGEPACEPRLYPPLPAARREALAVANTFRGPNGLSEDRVCCLVGPEHGPGADAITVLNTLLARPYRVVHIAGHGEPDVIEKGQPIQPRGVVLSDSTYLGPAEIQAMRTVPELVFLNCCHLAADAGQLLKPYDRAAFAGNLAQQLIRLGVRCVIAAGWAVEDDAAEQFARTFYTRLLQGQRFMDAVHDARRAAWTVSPQGNTWAAFQCYGDPDWVWQAQACDPNQTANATGDEYVGIASPAALVLALQTLVVETHTQDAPVALQAEKIQHLQTRFEADWGHLGQVAEAFGQAWAAVGNTQQALDSYRRALAAEDASASLATPRELARLEALLPTLPPT